MIIRHYVLNCKRDHHIIRSHQTYIIFLLQFNKWVMPLCKLFFMPPGYSFENNRRYKNLYFLNFFSEIFGFGALERFLYSPAYSKIKRTIICYAWIIFHSDLLMSWSIFANKCCWTDLWLITEPDDWTDLFSAILTNWGPKKSGSLNLNLPFVFWSEASVPIYVNFYQENVNFFKLM